MNPESTKVRIGAPTGVSRFQHMTRCWEVSVQRKPDPDNKLYEWAQIAFQFDTIQFYAWVRVLKTIERLESMMRDCSYRINGEGLDVMKVDVLGNSDWHPCQPVAPV